MRNGNQALWLPLRSYTLTLITGGRRVRFPPSEDVCVPARGAEGVLWDPLGHRLRLTCFGSTSDRNQPGNGDDRAINPGFTFC